MWVRISTADRSFCAGIGCPQNERRIAVEVTFNEREGISADARLGSVVDNFRINIARGPGVEAMFWPAPCGATLVAYDDDNVEIERGTVARIGIGTNVSLQVQL